MFNRKLALAALAMGCSAALAFAAGTVTLSLSSPQAGSGLGYGVAAGTPITWTIDVTVSGGDNAGLALVCVDLMQDPNNPGTFDLENAGGAPAGMEQFDRPAGVTNPSPDGTSPGYGGTPSGAAGMKSLLQIGGGQNTFGGAGANGIGMDPNVVIGVGQSGAQEVATGTFVAPATYGVPLTIALADGIANTIETANPLPQFSPVTEAAVAYGNQSLDFVVRELGDMNCDGTVDTYDIDAFVLALINQNDYEAAYPNCDYNLANINQDARVDTYDIDAFVAIVAQ